MSLCLLTAQWDRGAHNALASGALPTIKRYETSPLSSHPSIFSVYALRVLRGRGNPILSGEPIVVCPKIHLLIASRRRRSTSSAYVCSDHDATYTCKRVWSTVELAGGSDLMRICLCRCSLLSTSISHFAFLGLAIFVCRKGNCFLYILVQGCASGEHGHHLLVSSLL